MAEKKKPMRMCIACREMKEKNQLFRVVKTVDGIVPDKTGKVSGRGAYICDSEDCIKKLRKQRLLNKVFSMNVDDAVYDAVEEALIEKK